MQKKKIIILTILVIIILAIILLIASISKHTPKLIAKQTIDNYNYTITIGGYEYDINNLIQDPKDIEPTLSAGMIPIKRDGENWIITDTTQENWYDYSEYEPAYMMLSDGIYQSELVRNMEENGQKLASENLGVEIKEEELGTIYMWVPRITEGSTSLLYTKQECTVINRSVGTSTSKIFMSEADRWDYSYAGIWLEYEPLASNVALNNKVNRLNNGESDETYGFLANTTAYRCDFDNSIYYFLEDYIYSLSKKTMEYSNSSTDFNNTIVNTNIIKDLYASNGEYRTILRVTDTNKLEPIKATAHYDAVDGKIKIEVTHNKNEIKDIIFDRKEKLEVTTINGKTTADTGEIEIETGKYRITIIDVEGNGYEFYTNGKSVYATLYTDGTLGLSTGTGTISGKTVSKSYGDMQLSSGLPWNNDRSSIKTVNFVNKIQPQSVSSWFYNCTNLTAINNIANLDTSKVTDMSNMFYNCSSLTSLDVSNFDTSKVTNMNNMFAHCYKLTSLNVSKWDTRNVTYMAYMFSGDHTNVSNIKYMSLATLDVSNFDTSKVTNMASMFSCCNKLTTLDVSKWDTSKVTNMSFMFDSCSSLKSLNLNNLDTSKVTNMRCMFQVCSNLTSLNLKSFDTSNVTNMEYMFFNCRNLATIYVSASTWVEPEKKDYMFSYCKVNAVTKQ